MRRTLHTENAPEFTDSPLSQGIETEGFVFVVGMAVDDQSGTRMTEADTVEAETRICLESIGSVLAEAGCSLKDVVKTTVYVADRDDYDAMNKVYREYWDAGEEPVRCSLFVGIGADCRIEIEAIAVKATGAS